MTTGKGIYFVGGASASGKSVATMEMAADHDLPRIELDKIYNALDGACDEKDRKQVMRAVAANLTQQLLDSGASMIVEGGWINPGKAVELVARSGGRLCAVFCGYPGASAQTRFEMIQSHRATRLEHWLANWAQSDAIPIIQKQIEDSKQYREAAAGFNLPFFDFTDVSEGNRKLLGKVCKSHLVECHVR